MLLLKIYLVKQVDQRVRSVRHEELLVITVVIYLFI